MWACGCGGRARGCARVGLHQPQGTVAAPNAPVCLSRACGCVFRACAVTLHGFGAFARTSSHRRTAGAGRTRARCAAGPSTPRRCRRSPSGSASASSWSNCASRARRRRRRARSRRCRRCAAAPGAAAPGRWGRTPRRWMRRRRRCRSSAIGRAPRAHGWRARPDRRAVRGGPEPPGAAARWARRSADNTELAALPAAADWPSLKYL
jgi:hypothetical protein